MASWIHYHSLAIFWVLCFRISCKNILGSLISIFFKNFSGFNWIPKCPKRLHIFSCRTESAAALAKTFWRGPGWGLLGDVSKCLTTCTLKNSVGDQHVVSMLPVCCQHVVCMLLACCQYVASMLLACCQHVASLLPEDY